MEGPKRRKEEPDDQDPQRGQGSCKRQRKWDDGLEECIPDEVLCHILGMLPKNMVGLAARTCRRWFACSSPSLRKRLSGRVVSSRLVLLQWAVRNGYTMNERTCMAAANQGQLEVLKWARENGWP